MLSILLQGPGGGGGGGGGGGSHSSYHSGSGGGSCSTTCAIVIGSVVGGLGALFALVLVLIACSKKKITQQIDYHRQVATLSPTVNKQIDCSNLVLSANGQSTHSLTVHCTTTYRGHTANNRAWSVASFELTIDNDAMSRLITGSGDDQWGHFQVCGSFVLDSPTHGQVKFTKSYASYNVQYAGEVGSVRPLDVRGSWYTDAGTGDGGPFTMTFDQPLTIVDTGAQPTSAAVAVDSSTAAVDPPHTGVAVNSTDVEQPPLYTTAPFDYQHMYPQSESQRSGGSSLYVPESDVEMVPPPSLPPHFTQSL